MLVNNLFSYARKGGVGGAGGWRLGAWGLQGWGIERGTGERVPLLLLGCIYTEEMDIHGPRRPLST